MKKFSGVPSHGLKCENETITSYFFFIILSIIGQFLKHCFMYFITDITNPLMVLWSVIHVRLRVMFREVDVGGFCKRDRLHITVEPRYFEVPREMEKSSK